ncbi:MAG: 30S ribosomal protein S1, partial [Candidatus Omnitrophica bacterium]|nr:30S ribosomal protein S1 [Candidatus Omnitrophota bacterium]
MEEKDQISLAEMYEKTLRKLTEGEIVLGTIIDVTLKDVIVDIGYKSEGFISVDEFRDPEKVKIGNQVEVLVESVEDENGRLVLSHAKAQRLQGWQKIADQLNEGSFVDGRVIKQVNGGYIVDIEGVDAFLPRSLSAFKGIPVKDTIGTKYKFFITKMNKPRRNIILSRREVIQKERDEVKTKLWDKLEKGERRTGTVKGITDFGAFIDLGGIDGLLHITDMSWSRINHPSELVAIGNKIEVIILDFDRENSKVSLGLKQITANPWECVEGKYPVGSKIKGKIVNIMPYGLFIEIDKGIEGLLHSSEISWQKKMVNPQEMFAIGDMIEVQIISIDKDTKRISFRLKQLEKNPWLEVEGKFPPGTKVEGKVRGFTDYGAFVELEGSIEGMIHVSDMSWTRKVNHPQEIFKKGQSVEVVVLAVDPEQRKINLGYKQLKENPWAEIAQRHPVGSIME